MAIGNLIPLLGDRPGAKGFTSFVLNEVRDLKPVDLALLVGAEGEGGVEGNDLGSFDLGQLIIQQL